MSYHLLTLQTTYHEFTDDDYDRRQPERARRRALSTLERSVRRRTRSASDPTNPHADVPRFRQRLDRMFAIRVRAAAFKYGIKWVGNGVAKLGPFLLFMGGGWMIMARSISAGSSLRWRPTTA